MQKPIFYVLGIALLLGLVLLLGNGFGGEKALQSAGVLTATERTFDFGNIPMDGGNVTHRFPVRNTGMQPLTVRKVYTSCMCTTAYLERPDGKRYGAFGMPGHLAPRVANMVIGAGETAFVEAVFDPTAHGPAGVGLAERSIYLETDAEETPKVELRFTATVTR